jgi:hypothetical protein
MKVIIDIVIIIPTLNFSNLLFKLLSYHYLKIDSINIFLFYVSLIINTYNISE